MSLLNERFHAAVKHHPHKQSLLTLELLARQTSNQDRLNALTDQALKKLADIALLGGAVCEWIQFQPSLLSTLELPCPGHDDIQASVAEIAKNKVDDWEALRQIRRAMTLQIAAAEITCQNEEVPQIDSRQASALLSTLSSAIVQTGLEWLNLTEGFAVIALGKLGGWELNYSSDIDILYLSESKNPDFENRARLLTRELESAKAPGRLFRVDLRLRPYGRSGALVPSLAAAVKYYQKQGRSWERQAFVRACHLAGDADVGARFLKEMNAFVWDNKVEASSITKLVKLRERTAKDVKNPEAHLKQGPGGIREIEFVVQFLQMLHGQENESLRAKETCAAIDALANSSIIWAKEANALREAYIFQRSLEHLLQLKHDREEEIVPGDPEQRSILAYPFQMDLKSFDEAFIAHRRFAQSFLADVLQTPFSQSSDADESRSFQDAILQQDPKSTAGIQFMQDQGFENGKVALKNLVKLGHENNPLLAPSGRARTLLAGLAPTLVEAISKTSDPDRTLKNLTRAVETLGAKATFLQLLLQKDDTLKIFIRLAETSDFLIQSLARRPGVLDEVIDRLQTNQRVTKESIDRELALALNRPDPHLGLTNMAAINTLHTGIHDLSGRYNVQNTGRDLSFVADGLINGLLTLAYRALESRYKDRPRTESGELVSFAVMAVGKLGGSEITYGSDYDLLFIYEGNGKTPDGTTAQRFYHHLVQELITFGSRKEFGSDLAPIDPRLRPGGSKSLLVSSLSKATRYYAGINKGENAANWERLALSKIRPVAGEVEFGRLASIQILKACEEGCNEGLWKNIRTMREKQIKSREARNLKVGPGGLADVEFVTSAFSLSHRSDYPDLRKANTAELIMALRQHDFLTRSETQGLLTGYQYLTTVNARLRVLEGQPSALLPKLAKAQRALALRLGYVDTANRAEENFLEELQFQRSEILRICRGIIGREESKSQA
ncbi:MAG: hypothetical protein P1V97_07895 [Planctomycetota bacterium]|nr:hypothetical protein [Planctomycetota bacterium]